MQAEEEEYPDNTVEAKEKAESEGFEVVLGDDYTLLLDIDSAADLDRWHQSADRLLQYGVDVVEQEEWKSKSGNMHVRIKMKTPLPVRQRVGLEAILGSDRKRAGLSYREAERAEFPCMLFKPKAKVASAS